MKIIVEQIMKTDIYTAKEGTNIVSAVKEMKKRKIGSVIVVRKKEAVGIVTSTDVLYKGIAEERNLKETTIGSIMTSPLIVIEPEAALQDAAALMSEYSIKKLPVVKSDGELVGILTAADILSRRPEYLDVLINLAVPQKARFSE